MRHRIDRPRRERPAHPGEGELRAYLDGELSRVSATRIALHVRACAACRQGLADLRSLDTRATSLLTTLIPARAKRAPARMRGSALPLAALASAVAAFAFWFNAQPATNAHTTGGYRVHDVCCFNLDGGERADDGLLTVSRAGEVVDCVLLYEDRAGLRRFAQRDPLRFMSGARDVAQCEPGLLADLAAAPSLALAGGS